MLELILIAAGGYGGVVALMFVLQRRLMYYPDQRRLDPETNGAPDMTETVYRTADGTMLTGWYRAPSSAPVLVYFQGNAGHFGDRIDKVRPFLDAGYGVLLAGYRGYAGNHGRPTETGLIADGRAALAHLARQGIPPERVVFYGESLGSGVAVAVAAERSPAALILEAPFTSITDVAARAYPFVPVRLALLDRFDSLSRIGAVSAPTLVLHGERDETVPVGLGRRLFDAAGEPKRVALFPEGGHSDLHDHGAARIALDFLKSHGLA